MSRLAGRLTMPGEENASDGRNKRMFAGMMGHINATARPANERPQRNEGSSRNEEEYQRPMSERVTRGNRGSRGGQRGMNNRGRGGYERRGEGRGGYNRSYNDRDQDREDQPRESTKRAPTQRVEDGEPAEELLDLEDLIEQISDLNVRCDRSAAQIKRNILASEDLLETMEDEEWQRLCQSMIKTAIDDKEADFIVDICVSLIRNDRFVEAMSDEIIDVSSKHIMEKNDTEAIDTVNLLLYTTTCIVKGWILVINEDSENFKPKTEKKVENPPIEDPSNEENTTEKSKKEEQKEEEKIIEEPEIVRHCAIGLKHLCEASQRQLWLKWPEITDEIYECIRTAVAYNVNLPGDVKIEMLNTLMSISKWSNNRNATTKNAHVQTVPQNF